MSLIVILAILIVASGAIRDFCPGRAPRQPKERPPGGERDLKSCSPLDTDGNLSWSNRDITTHLPFFTTIMRPVPGVNITILGGYALREYVVTAVRRSHQARKPGTVVPVRKLASAEFPEGDLRRFCVCHRQAGRRALCTGGKSAT